MTVKGLISEANSPEGKRKGEWENGRMGEWEEGIMGEERQKAAKHKMFYIYI
jgi:hypothetical protein